MNLFNAATIGVDVNAADPNPPASPWLHWVIAGGESGPNARPMHPAWARSLRDQCKNAGVPFLFKQWGEWIGVYKPKDADEIVQCALSWPKGKWMEPSGEIGEHKTWQCWRIAHLGKKAAGRTLDGQIHHEFPKP